MERDLNLEETIDRLAETPLLYQPGTKYHYGAGFEVAARLIEILSGDSFEVYLKKNIFDPLGMNDTGFYVPADKVDRLATVYEKATADELKEKGYLRSADFGVSERVAPSGSLRESRYVWATEFTTKPRFTSGGHGLVSTVHDYYQFASMLLYGGILHGKRFLNEATLELMLRDYMPADSGFEKAWAGHHMGLGHMVLIDQNQANSSESIGSYNWGGAATTDFWIDPKEEIIGVLFAQYLPHNYDVRREFKNIVYDALIEDPWSRNLREGKHEHEDR